MSLSISAMNHFRHLRPRRMQRRKPSEKIDTSSCRYVTESAQLSSESRFSHQSRDSAIDVDGLPSTPSPRPYRRYEDSTSIHGDMSEYGGSTLCGAPSEAGGRYSEEMTRKGQQAPSGFLDYQDLIYSSDEEDDLVNQLSQLYSPAEVAPTEVWNDLLPWLLSNFNTILGERNPGAIDLLQDSETPTICITAEDTSLVNCHPLEQRLAFHSRLRFDIDIQQGFVGRTNRGSGHRKTRWPAANPNFYQWPTCGASIGVDGADDVASLGGFVQLRFKEDGDWLLMGLTSHHLLEERTPSTIPGCGVGDGILNGRSFRITQPASQHIEEEQYRLRRHIKVNEAMTQRLSAMRDEDAKQQLLLNRESLHSQLALVWELDAAVTHFGNVFQSSGYGIMVDKHQMDWALISSIPASRYTASNLLPSFPIPNLGFNPTITPLTTVFPPANFSAISTLSPQLAMPHLTAPESIARIHGCGAISGPQSGFLSGVTSLVKLGHFDSPSLEWSFAPYHTLGTHGDSGAWIFSDFGEVVGMIVGRNEATGLTYFTPMHVILRDIQQRTGAKDVRIAKWDKPYRDSGIDVSSRRTSYATTADPAQRMNALSTVFDREMQGSGVEIDLEIDESSKGKTISRASSMALGEHMIPRPFPMAKPRVPPKSVGAAAQGASREKRLSVEKPLPVPPNGGVNIIHATSMLGGGRRM